MSSTSKFGGVSFAANSLTGELAQKAEQSMDLAQDRRIREIGAILFPLLCVSVHEHAWVGAGYGVWGKEEYIKRFWSVVNWGHVSELFGKAHPASAAHHTDPDPGLDRTRTGRS